MAQRVLIVQRRMTEYRVPMFEQLRRRLANEGVRLSVVYGTPTAEEAMRRDQAPLLWGVQIPCRYIRLPGSLASYQALPADLIDGQDLVVIPHENRLLQNYSLLARRRLGRGRLAFWGHGANFQTDRAGGMREALKAWSTRLVDWWFAYTQASVDRVAANGFPKERITCLDNAVDTRQLVDWRNALTSEEIDALRSRLGVGQAHVAVFIGSLHEARRIGFLLAAAARIRKRLPDFDLVVIGDGVLRGEMQAFAARHGWCKWVGAHHGREKVLHMALGRVMLNPGMVGLNLLDAFAARVPLVTTDCDIHSPEIAYLEPGRNGLITPDDLDAFAEEGLRVLTDAEIQGRLAEGCREAAMRYTLDRMVENFSGGIVRALQSDPRRVGKQRNGAAESAQALPEWHIAVIWQRFLPYHVARLRHLAQYCAERGIRLTAIEVATQDLSYGFEPGASDGAFERICCFPGRVYHELTSRAVHASVLRTLKELDPDVVFAPATPFPEGMAAVAYRNGSTSRLFMMDDAWEHTDRRPRFVRAAKRVIHRSIDGVFVPAASHAQYFRSLGFPDERIVFGVDVVDNEHFARGAERARAAATRTRADRRLSPKYFLFVGRQLPRKGLDTLLDAYRVYRRGPSADPWGLVIVGGGPLETEVRRLAAASDDVHVLGAQFGEALLDCYGLAGALVAPSESDPWALVVNEGMAAGLPVIVSRGCGSAGVLVEEGGNGWTFEPGDARRLAEIFRTISSIPADVLAKMGQRSREIIDAWSLNRYVQGVASALDIPRRMGPDIVSRLASRTWKGRVTVT